MNLRVPLPPRDAVGSPVMPVLRAVLLADLADSTAFVQRFGDARAAAALQRLDLLIRDLLEFTGGRLIDKADGLLAIFERPIQAVDFALRYQHGAARVQRRRRRAAWRRASASMSATLMTWSNSEQDVRAGAKPLEVEGLAKPVAARLMALALPGQILMSSMAQALAQRAQAELGERAERLRWMSHGRYRFKGVPAPVLVHEVGEVGASPLKQPPSGHKVWRELPLWRRPPVLAVELMLFLAVIGFYGWTLLRSPPALAFQQRDWVVVGDLNNFTGDVRLDDSLDTALRISLEQSRYMNVVPEMKVQSVLRRMGRGPEATVDRAIGSEIALREGARVLVLPSVAEVGGKLRVSLEVVDPTNQVTVYADSAEGRGIESVLVSLDTINGRLREKLGESIGDIRTNGKPLAQITTPSLEALRLYTLANEAAMQHYRFDESMRLLDLALREDPEFALAWSSRARLHLANSDLPRARADLTQAVRFRARLSTREALTVDTGLAEFGPVQSRIDIWKVVASLYPDVYRAHYQIAFNRGFYLQQYQQALVDLKPALVPQNQRHANALHLMGLLNTGLERIPEARLAFERGESLGGRDPLRYHAYTYAVQRQFDRARQLLKGEARTGFAGADLDARLPEISFPLDEGKWQEALQAAKQLSEAAVDAPLQKRTFRGTWLGLRAYEQPAAALPELRAFAETELARARRVGDPEIESSTFAALYASALLARHGDPATAARTVAALAESVPRLGYPALDDMLAIAQAEIALRNDDSRSAVATLRARLTGSELNQVHAVLLRAYLRDKSLADARREAEWLATHRGRAYVEWGSQYLLQPSNVLESDLALLTLAEIGVETGDELLASQQLARFESAWKQPPAFLTGRVQALRHWLSQRKNQTAQRSAR